MRDPISDKPRKVAQAFCPNCGAQPITLSQQLLNFPNGAVVSMVCCSTCGFILPHVVVGMRVS